MLSPDAEKESIRVGPERPEVCIVCPVFNEKEIVPKLLDLFQQVLSTLDRSYELIMVDDGSQDGTLELLKARLGIIPDLKIVQLYRNYGQVAAASAGMTLPKATGSSCWTVICSMIPVTSPAVAEVSWLRGGHLSQQERRNSPALADHICCQSANRFATGVKSKTCLAIVYLAPILDMITMLGLRTLQHASFLPLCSRHCRNSHCAITPRTRPSKWTFNQFILFISTSFSPKAIQVLLSLGFSASSSVHLCMCSAS
jgi:hypothetical protein